jgi:hypothetical protein
MLRLSLSRGANGPDVRRAQEALRQLGYLESSPDGIYGSMTENAVVIFQKAKGLKADGILGKKTWAEMFGSDSAPIPIAMGPRDYLIDVTARTESGGNYDAWNPDDNKAGVSFGLVQFNQKKGSLARLMRKMHEKNPEKFQMKFKNLDPALVAQLQNDMGIKELDLNQPDIKTAIRSTAKDAEFRQAQRDLANEVYLTPAIEEMSSVGLNSQRAVAIAFDTAVQRGVAGMGTQLDKAVKEVGTEDKDALLKKFVEYADNHKLANERRTRLLNSSLLGDGPWDT